MINSVIQPALLVDENGNPLVGANGKIPVSSSSTPSTTVLTSRVAINAASSGDNTLVAAVASQTIRVYGLFLVVTSAVNIKFKNGAGTDFHPALPLQAGGSFVLDENPNGDPWFITSSGSALILNLSGAVQVSGVLYYLQS